jgi:preprotein translocase subunit YajC
MDNQQQEEKKSFELLRKHSDTIVVLGGILAAVLWINGEFNTVRSDIASVKTDLAVVKTVLQMKNIMPEKYAICEKEKS